MSSVQGKIVTINSQHINKFPSASKVKRMTKNGPLSLFVRFDSGLGMPVKLSRANAIGLSNYLPKYHINLASGTEIKASCDSKSYIKKFTDIGGHNLTGLRKDAEKIHSKKKPAESKAVHTETLSQLEASTSGSGSMLSSNASNSYSSAFESNQSKSTKRSSSMSSSSVSSAESSASSASSASSESYDMPSNLKSYQHVIKSSSINISAVKHLMNGLVSKPSHDVYTGLKKAYTMEHWHDFDTKLVAHGGKALDKALKTPLTQAYMNHALEDNTIPDNLNKKHIHHKKHKKPLHDVNVY